MHPAEGHPLSRGHMHLHPPGKCAARSSAARADAEAPRLACCQCMRRIMALFLQRVKLTSVPAGQLRNLALGIPRQGRPTDWMGSTLCACSLLAFLVWA